jgi:molybdopterin molybdotransferase
LVTFEVFVRPAVNALLGVPDPLPAYRQGVLGRTVRRNPHRDEFLRARTSHRNGQIVLEPLSGQESHMIVRAGQADALVAVEAGESELAEGSEVPYLALS